MKPIISAEYKTFFKEIKERIYKAQYDALKSVNKELINLYWDIGKSIVARQDKLGWGKAIVESLAKDQQKEFPGIQGFSARNLWNMRTFYLTYKDNQKLQPLAAEISWTKNVVIMERCKDDIRREFYIKATKKFGWTKDALINQLEAIAFERFMANQTNFDKALPEKYRHQAKLAVRGNAKGQLYTLYRAYKQPVRQALRNYAFCQAVAKHYGFTDEELDFIPSTCSGQASPTTSNTVLGGIIMRNSGII